MFVSKSPVRIENNVLTALSFPREAHKSFNIQHMKLHSFPDYSQTLTALTVCGAVTAHLTALTVCRAVTAHLESPQYEPEYSHDRGTKVYNHSLRALGESQCLLGRPWSAW